MYRHIRELFEEYDETVGKALYPEDYLSLNETLKQYNIVKPVKYGLIFQLINCALYSPKNLKENLTIPFPVQQIIERD